MRISRLRLLRRLRFLLLLLSMLLRLLLPASLSSLVLSSLLLS
jgi:hypothetical protein